MRITATSAARDAANRDDFFGPATAAIGVAPEQAETIFKMFGRLHPIEAYPGTGIGLALCKKIVENHHGEIYARSKEGGGAAFYVLLPVKQPD